MSRDAWITFTTAMEIFEDVDSTDESVLDAIRATRSHLHGADNVFVAARDAFEYWATAFDLVMRATDREDIKQVVRRYMCSSDPRSMSKFNVAQGLMKATSHAMWRRLYEFEAGRLRTDVRDAVHDAITSPTDRGIESMREIYEELAAENDETVDEMMERVVNETAPQVVERLP